MNREIKFRAWDKTHKTFTDHHITVGLDGWVCDHTIDDGRDDIVLLQYTGLKDWNGAEIYEGDILEHPDASRFKVFWSQCDVGFKAHYGFEPYSNICLQVGDKGLAAVIGNIYESPELLPTTEEAE